MTKCKPIQHGTYGGEMAHRRRSEKPCAECREARKSYRRTRAHVERESARAARQADPERFKEYRRRTYWKDPEKSRQQAKESRLREPDAIKERNRLRYINDPGRYAAEAKQWRSENPHMVKAGIRRQQELSDLAKASATRGHSRWTVAEDQMLATWQGGDLELAFALGRGYKAIASRRLILRKRGQLTTSTNHKEN